MQCTCVLLSHVACPAVHYFSILSHKRQDFRKNKKAIEHEMCVLIFYAILSQSFLILRRVQRDTIKKYIDLHVKYASFLSDFNETLILPTYFPKSKYQIL